MKLFKINKYVYLVLSFVFFALGVLFVVLSSTQNNKGLLYLSIICFLFFTISMQTFMSKIVGVRMRKKMYKKRYYTIVDERDMVQKLKENKFNFKKNKFGTVAIKMEGSTVYKVTIVDDVAVYLSDDKNKIEDKKTPGIEYAKELVGFEFYTNNYDNIYERSENLSFTGDKVFYTAFNYDLENNRIVEVNAIDPETHADSYNKLKSMLGLEEIK